MSTKVYSRDFIVSAKHFEGDIFEWDFKNVSDNQKNHQAKGSKASYDTTWVPLLFKKLDSEGNVQLVCVRNFDFEYVIVSSKPTLPSKDDKDNGQANKHKCMLLVFKEMSLEEIRTGDYVPKVKNTPDDQARENKRVEELTLLYHKNTKEFVEAWDAIATGFDILADKICKQFEADPDSFSFNMVKEPNWVIKERDGSIKLYNPPKRSVRQTHRKDEKNPNRTIALEKPIFRLKMPVHDNKMLVTWRNKGVQETREYIYDARKTIIDTRSGIERPQLAKVRSATTGELCSLNINNVGDFIRYKSVLSGRIELPKLVISKQGISLVNEFKELLVKRYKAKQQADTCVRRETLINMKGDSDDEDVVEELPELNVQLAKRANVTTSNKSSSSSEESKSGSEDEASDVEATPKARISRVDVDNKINAPPKAGGPGSTPVKGKSARQPKEVAKKTKATKKPLDYEESDDSDSDLSV